MWWYGFAIPPHIPLLFLEGIFSTVSLIYNWSLIMQDLIDRLSEIVEKINNLWGRL